jgi:hypothetical protein
MPVIEPESDWCDAWTSSGVRNLVCPVSPTASTSPRVAPYVSFVGSIADWST